MKKERCWCLLTKTMFDSHTRIENWKIQKYWKKAKWILLQKASYMKVNGIHLVRILLHKNHWPAAKKVNLKQIDKGNKYLKYKGYLYKTLPLSRIVDLHLQLQIGTGPPKKNDNISDFIGFGRIHNLIPFSYANGIVWTHTNFYEDVLEFKSRHKGG